MGVHEVRHRESCLILLDEEISIGGGVRSVIVDLLQRSALACIYVNLSHSDPVVFHAIRASVVTPFPRLLKVARWSKSVKVVLTVAAIIPYRRYTLMYVHQPVSIVLALAVNRVFGVKYVYHCHGISGPANLERLGWIYRVAVKQASEVIVVSEYVNRQLAHIPHRKPYSVVYNGTTIISTNANQRHAFDYVFVGRICREKSPLSFIRALSKVDGKFTAAVIGPCEDEIYSAEALAAIRADSRVQYLGALSKDDTRALISKASVLVCPSKWGEPFGLVVIEAMASGTIVVARRDGAIPEIVTDGVNGFLFDDDDELPLLLRRLRAADTAAIAHAALLTVESRFDVSVQAGKIAEILRRNAGS